MGTFFHFTMYTFVSQPNPVTARHQDCGAVFNADLAAMPHPSVFNPSNASTMVDQWMVASKAMGARYAILVAKHCDGFISFPTNARSRTGRRTATACSSPRGAAARGSRAGLRRIRAQARHLAGVLLLFDGNFYLSVADGKPTPATAAGHAQRRLPSTAIVLAQLAKRLGQLGEIWFDGKTRSCRMRRCRRRLPRWLDGCSHTHC